MRRPNTAAPPPATFEIEAGTVRSSPRTARSALSSTSTRKARQWDAGTPSGQSAPARRPVDTPQPATPRRSPSYGASGRRGGADSRCRCALGPSNRRAHAAAARRRRGTPPSLHSDAVCTPRNAIRSSCTCCGSCRRSCPRRRRAARSPARRPTGVRSTSAKIACSVAEDVITVRRSACVRTGTPEANACAAGAPITGVSSGLPDSSASSSRASTATPSPTIRSPQRPRSSWVTETSQGKGLRAVGLLAAPVRRSSGHTDHRRRAVRLFRLVHWSGAH